MISGHFSTALVAHQKFPKGTLLYFLVASQLQDLLWFLFHYLGLEPTTPADVFATTLNNLTANMVYSHDLLPQIFWMVVIFVAGKVLFKSNTIGIVGAVIVLAHFLFDLLSGFPHFVFGPDTQNISLGLYKSNVYLAIVIDAIFTAVLVWYFFREEAKKGIVRSSANKRSIIGVLVFGVLFLASIATVSFREMFNIPEFDIGFNTTVPNILLSYVAMIFLLNYFIPKYKQA